MEKPILHSLLLSFMLLTGFMLDCHCDDGRKVYIVYMGDRLGGDALAARHHSMLENVLNGSNMTARESMLYSYERSFNGFAAKLSEEEAEKISDMEGVISVFQSKIYQPHTTRSWDFLGLPATRSGGCQEGDVIVGLLDTGIWPEAKSFDDNGLSSPPAKWKGRCVPDFPCNNKLIGARNYIGRSPRDVSGHGTHIASIAGGRKVDGASYFGLAKGLARGGVPAARIAVYKACGSFGCLGSALLKAFDDAIADGVDIISISVGASPRGYMDDVIAIGSYHAMKQGILTSASAGNDGPYASTVKNIAPWILTVAASTIDRKFTARVMLGNGQVFAGLAVNTFDLNGTVFPLVWGGDVPDFSAKMNSVDSRKCRDNSLNSCKVKGTIVLCDEEVDGSEVLRANGVGMITAANNMDTADSYLLPATLVYPQDRDVILDYIRSTRNPIATILMGETWKDEIAPYVAEFSSRGPQFISPDILKPDLAAPGVDILAAWSPVAPPTDSLKDNRSVNYNVISGTSLSSPHAAGAAAYVKAAHPHWSPAAIKSALMTTASVMDPRKTKDYEFSYGSGNINPVAALNPGLVFNASEADYLHFLCQQGYICHRTKPERSWDLNYPSFSLAIEDGHPVWGYFTRTVTNVGFRNSTYHATVHMPLCSFSTAVEPPVLSFSYVGEKKSFAVIVEGPKLCQEKIISGAIVWQDGVHVVRTPVVVYTPSSCFSRNPNPSISIATMMPAGSEGSSI